mmetsp:Transcript_18160/g.34622  ORF Transcript_18160/g.34622 Transcript_18160/m.34622 type:complete len:277 (-) Transcript_18160:1499-2329(-)
MLLLISSIPAREQKGTVRNACTAANQWFDRVDPAITKTRTVAKHLEHGNDVLLSTSLFREHLREDAADDRSRSEAVLVVHRLGSVGLVPIRKRDARRCFVGKLENGVGDALELLLASHDRHPHLPVRLRELGACVEGHAVCVHLRLVVLSFLNENVVRIHVETQNLVPDQVVLEGERGAVEVVLQLVVVPGVGPFHPDLRVVFRGLAVVFRLLFGNVSPVHFQELCVRSHADDTLRREVDVVGRGPLEVVGAQLVARVGQRLYQEITPCIHDGPVR